MIPAFLKTSVLAQCIEACEVENMDIKYKKPNTKVSSPEDLIWLIETLEYWNYQSGIPIPILRYFQENRCVRKLSKMQNSIIAAQLIEWANSQFDVKSLLKYGYVNEAIALYPKDTLEELLFESCKCGSINCITQLIELGVDVHDDDENALAIACHNGFEDIVRLLLRGADIRDGFALLTHACAAGHANVVQLLLNHGIDIHMCNDEPIVFACDNNRLDVVRLLIQHGANVNATDFWGRKSILTCAYDAKNYELANLLLELGAHNPFPTCLLLK
jgi:hypothetical protein